ncbi:hypothetical protein GXM_02063 [Nostoc sphaeroides CCNUC1]|uniref:Uncharacterized protein n=1 Tax=Nostoc sphaeroides CCNUC1 TaxID=2653204 RepID=A0A5P8VVY4_9NOSO|nr:hypothetical protein GXM_02063 [Nostoc sphaeroides CCNUC1]
MNFSVTQQSLDNVGFRSSTQPTLELFFRLNRTVLRDRVSFGLNREILKEYSSVENRYININTKQ